MLTNMYPKTVTLKDDRNVVLRPLVPDDFERLFDFFQALPSEDRLLLRHDVQDRELVRKWTEEVDFDHVVPIVALEGDRIVADGTLHFARRGWMRHVGQVRMVMASSHRHTGLGLLIARELVSLAEQHGLDKLEAHVIEDDVAAVKMSQKLGFRIEAVLQSQVKDLKGEKHNLAIMTNEVADLERIMEDWMLDSMLPAYRAPQ